MCENQIAAGTRSEYVAATLNLGTGKDSDSLRGYHQRRVLSLLESGRKLSAADISGLLMVSDPRSHIRDLRSKGIPISDEWVKSEHGSRFKRYFIRNDVRQ